MINFPHPGWLGSRGTVIGILSIAKFTLLAQSSNVSFLQSTDVPFCWSTTFSFALAGGLEWRSTGTSRTAGRGTLCSRWTCKTTGALSNETLSHTGFPGAAQVFLFTESVTLQRHGRIACFGVREFSVRARDMAPDFV